MKFRTALIAGAVICLGMELLLGNSRPALADRWVADSVSYSNPVKGKKSITQHGRVEMDFYAAGEFHDPQPDGRTWSVRFDFDESMADVAKRFGFPEASYTKGEPDIRQLDNGRCFVDKLQDVGINGGKFRMKEGCPDFIVNHGAGDKVMFWIEDPVKGRMSMFFERETRLNPIQRFMSSRHLMKPEHVTKTW